MLRRLVFVAAFCALTVSVSATPVVWSPADGGNGHAFEVIAAPNGISWDDARSASQARGGDLASITSAAENDFVFSLIDDETYWWQFNSSQAIGPWIGGYWTGGSGPTTGWNWVSGDPFVYTNWEGGEPDHFDGEDRLDYSDFTGHPRSNRWNDLGNNGTVLPHGYVVEYVPEPALAALACGILLTLIRRRADKTAAEYPAR